MPAELITRTDANSEEPQAELARPMRVAPEEREATTPVTSLKLLMTSFILERDVPEVKVNSRLPLAPATSMVNDEPVVRFRLVPPIDRNRPPCWADCVTVTSMERLAPENFAEPMRKSLTPEATELVL